MANEKRLIKPETIKLELAFIGCEPKHLAAVDRCAIVDAVEVVRCKDCQCWDKAVVNKKGFLICPASGMEIMADDFCSYGERREGE